MGEGGVIQADRDAAADYFELIGETNRAIVTRRGQYDLSACVQSHARHRQAAEKATREECAKVAEACPFVPWKYQTKEWGEAFETGRSRAAIEIATAIRSQNDG